MLGLASTSRTFSPSGSGRSERQAAARTFWLIGLLLQLLRLVPNLILIVFDLKSELSALLATLLASLPDIRELTPHLHIVRPFGDGTGPPDSLPRLRITRAQPDVPKEIQATNITASIAASLTGDLGQRMERVCLKLVSLAIALDEPLPG